MFYTIVCFCTNSYEISSS